MTPEKRFENKIKSYLDSKGIWHVKFFANAFTRAGIPDLLCCVNGHFLAIEVKAEKGRPSELQKRELAKIAEAGGKGIVLYPEHFEWFKEYIDKLMED
jgi:Holliday junction resolvase